MDDISADYHHVQINDEKTTHKSSFQIPTLVPDKWTKPSLAVIYHNIKNPSTLVRVYVIVSVTSNETASSRENIIFNDNFDTNKWRLKSIFFAYRSVMPHTQSYHVSYAKEPFRTRLLPSNGTNKKARCDITKWFDSFVEDKLSSFSSSPPTNNASNHNNNSFFFAYPVGVPGSTTSYHVDFAVNPDRYFVTTSPQPEWRRKRCFSFHAYQAQKIFVLQSNDPLTYKIVSGSSLHEAMNPVSDNKDNDTGEEVMDNDNNNNIITAPPLNWTCIMAFCAFTHPVPGTHEYHIQERNDNPYHRTRISMVPSNKHEWKKKLSFWAWDVPMPGTAKYAIQYLTPNKASAVEDGGFDSRIEQSRIYVNDAWGDWKHKLYFYAYPVTRLY